MEPLRDFFLQYTWFTYDPRQSASEQFYRLCDEAHWRRYNPERGTAWENYLRAIVRQFNASFGVDDDDLPTWHRLLFHIGIVSPPRTVKKCKSLMRGKFINLIDLIDARDNPSLQIDHFPNEVELSKYTKEKHKIFPRNHVDAGALLKYLLRNIDNPDPNRKDRSGEPSTNRTKRGKKPRVLVVV